MNTVGGLILLTNNLDRTPRRFKAGRRLLTSLKVAVEVLTLFGAPGSPPHLPGHLALAPLIFAIV